MNFPTVHAVDLDKEMGQGIVIPKGWRLIAIRPLTAYLDDRYLSVVLCERIEHVIIYDNYVIWTYNWKDHGCSTGDYRLDIKDALLAFCNRK